MPPKPNRNRGRSLTSRSSGASPPDATRPVSSTKATGKASGLATEEAEVVQGSLVVRTPAPSPTATRVRPAELETSQVVEGTARSLKPLTSTLRPVNSQLRTELAS
eukprot:COSAG02_NODE_22944_length_735_cov_0.907233_2_plen_105_part_01